MEQYLPNIFGGMDSRDVLEQRIEDYTEDRAAADIAEFQRQFNDISTSVESLLVVEGVTVKTKRGIAAGGEMQEAAERGDVEGRRGGEEYETAFPIKRFKDRMLYTEEYIATQKLSRLNADVMNAAIANMTTRLKGALRAIFQKANYVFDDGEFPGGGFGDLTIRRLLNADGTAGVVYVNGSPVSLGALNHYVTSGSATLDIDAFGQAKDKLRAVGYGDDTVYVVGTAMGDTIAAEIAEFVGTSDPGIVDPEAAYAVVQNPRSIGRIRDSGGADGEVLVMPFIPDGYIFTYDRSKGRPVYRRVHADERFRGWRLIQDQTLASYGEKSIRNKYWEYIAGWGVNDRLNGVCTQITSSGTYTNPSI